MYAKTARPSGGPGGPGGFAPFEASWKQVRKPNSMLSGVLACVVMRPKVVGLVNRQESNFPVTGKATAQRGQHGRR
jgi:hypothetical protein